VSKNLMEISELNFASEVTASALPVLVDFTAAWCPPCRAIAPHVEAVAREHAGRLTVGTCDVDGNPRLASELGVRSMPTLLLFVGGRVVGQIVGAVPRGKIEAMIAGALAAA
jgi:thioredoxin 1